MCIYHATQPPSPDAPQPHSQAPSPHMLQISCTQGCPRRWLPVSSASVSQPLSRPSTSPSLPSAAGASKHHMREIAITKQDTGRKEAQRSYNGEAPRTAILASASRWPATPVNKVSASLSHDNLDWLKMWNDVVAEGGSGQRPWSVSVPNVSRRGSSQ